MNGLEQVLNALNSLGFRLEAWINGSFLTQKINPEDSDVTVRFRGEDYDTAPAAQKLAFFNFVGANHKPQHKCDLYAFPEYDAGHPLYELGQWRGLIG